MTYLREMEADPELFDQVSAEVAKAHPRVPEKVRLDIIRAVMAQRAAETIRSYAS